MERRTLLKGAAVLAASSPLNVYSIPSEQYDSTFGTRPANRLDQGPFEIDQDDGWLTLAFTTPSEKPLRNPGLGLVGYAWEESGPSLAARQGRETLEAHVEKLVSLPFVEVLYIRCDWRDVQKAPRSQPCLGTCEGRSEAARAAVAFRVAVD